MIEVPGRPAGLPCLAGVIKQDCRVPSMSILVGQCKRPAGRVRDH